MPRPPIPDLCREARCNLMMEVIQYLHPIQTRIWDHPRVTSAVAELLRAIVIGEHANSYGATWLIQVLKKMPPLWERVAVYYSY